eukprot:scpid30984/ scgid19813/ 
MLQFCCFAHTYTRLVGVHSGDASSFVVNPCKCHGWHVSYFTCLFTPYLLFTAIANLHVSLLLLAKAAGSNHSGELQSRILPTIPPKMSSTALYSRVCSHQLCRSPSRRFTIYPSLADCVDLFILCMR